MPIKVSIDNKEKWLSANNTWQSADIDSNDAKIAFQGSTPGVFYGRFSNYRSPII